MLPATLIKIFFGNSFRNPLKIHQEMKFSKRFFSNLSVYQEFPTNSSASFWITLKKLTRSSSKDTSRDQAWQNSLTHLKILNATDKNSNVGICCHRMCIDSRTLLGWAQSRQIVNDWDKLKIKSLTLLTCIQPNERIRNSVSARQHSNTNKIGKLPVLPNLSLDEVECVFKIETLSFVGEMATSLLSSCVSAWGEHKSEYFPCLPGILIEIHEESV